MDGGAKCGAAGCIYIRAFISVCQILAQDHAEISEAALPRAQLGAEAGTPLLPGLALGLREAGKPQPGDRGDREGKSCRTQESPWADPLVFC